MVTRLDNITSVPVAESTGTRVRLTESVLTAQIDRYLETLDKGTRTPTTGLELADFFTLVQMLLYLSNSLREFLKIKESLL